MFQSSQPAAEVLNFPGPFPHSPIPTAPSTSANPQNNPDRAFQSHLKILKKCARNGNLAGWQLHRPKLRNLARACGIDLGTDSAWRAELKTLYQAVLRRAQQRYLKNAQFFIQRSKTLRILDGTNSSQQLLEKAEGLRKFAASLERQLR